MIIQLEWNLYMWYKNICNILYIHIFF